MVKTYFICYVFLYCVPFSLESLTCLYKPLQSLDKFLEVSVIRPFETKQVNGYIEVREVFVEQTSTCISFSQIHTVVVVDI